MEFNTEIIQQLVFKILVAGRQWQGKLYATIWNIPSVKKVFHRFVYEPKNQELKNIHVGKRAFIIGNGPSILKQDLTKLNGEITFVLNSFIHHSQYHEINPTYLCACDPFYNDKKYRRVWYKFHMETNTTKTTMLFDKSTQKLDQKYGLFKNHKVYYLRTASKLLPPLSSLQCCPTDLTLPLSGHFLVFMDSAILAAYYMGIKTIYLLGFDSEPINSFQDFINYDFFGKNPLFSLAEYKKQYQFYHNNRALQQSRVGLYEKSAACIKRTFAKRGVRIFNATYNKGYLPGFDYVDFEDVIKRK